MAGNNQSRENTPITRQEVREEVESLLKQYTSNGGTNGGMPRNWVEFAYKGAMTFGVPVVIICVVMLIVYQTFPGWVQANIQTQQSLTRNLEKQTKNIEAQTGNIEAQTKTLETLKNSVENIVVSGKSSQDAITDIEADHQRMFDEHARQEETQKAMVETLEAIRDSLKERQ